MPKITTPTCYAAGWASSWPTVGAPPWSRTPRPRPRTTGSRQASTYLAGLSAGALKTTGEPWSRQKVPCPSSVQAAVAVTSCSCRTGDSEPGHRPPGRHDAHRAQGVTPGCAFRASRA